ncbi:hypothetical protein EJ08DRAFT_31736 [Tothia fuscella]|uniref:DUF7730 domain-containing protein n=1 Tax=Tothia fuscella TaxID=1048955 RepID=A0A9P4TTD6_9PEZI|nr:hypothetical protein EJ08DRAFT_31736 [Tothia fuscella]
MSRNMLDLSISPPAMQALTLRNQKESPFLAKLPRELRDVIYELVLGNHTIQFWTRHELSETEPGPGLDHHDPKNKEHHVRSDRLIELAFLQTSRQIYDEASLLFYTHSIFSLRSRDFDKLRAVLMPQQRSAIRTFWIQSNLRSGELLVDSPSDFFTAFSGVQYLTLDLYIQRTIPRTDEDDDESPRSHFLEFGKLKPLDNTIVRCMQPWRLRSAEIYVEEFDELDPVHIRFKDFFPVPIIWTTGEMLRLAAHIKGEVLKD